MRERNSEDPLLELIPREHLSSEQNAFQQSSRADDDVPMYRLLREPTHLEEFDWATFRNIVIWRVNGTLICVGDYNTHSQYQERKLSFLFERVGKHRLNCTIFGHTDAAIADTADFFWSLEHPKVAGAALHTDNYFTDFTDFLCICDSTFEFAVLSAEALARILDANSSRTVSFPCNKLSAEQSVILASRPYPLNLKLTVLHCGLGFKDEGTAFVDALEKRQSPFGSLDIACHRDSMAFSGSNMKRILGLDWMFEKLTIRSLNEDLLFLPFSAKVKALDYMIQAKHIQPKDYNLLDIVATDLELEIDLDGTVNWSERMISFCKRLQGLGHFERLSFSFQFSFPWLRREGIEPVVPALIDAIKGNTMLKYLDLRRIQYLLNKDTTLMEDIFHAIEEHPELRTLVLEEYPPGYYSDEDDDENNYIADDDNTGGSEDEDDDSPQWDFFSLERLLKRNRNITVCDYRGKKFTNKGSIDKIYALNRFYNGSAKLVKEGARLRSSLVATTLTENASANFQHTSLLLSNHADMLCELIQGVNMDDLVTAGLDMEATNTSATAAAAHFQTTDRPKRESRNQPARALKRTAR